MRASGVRRAKYIFISIPPGPPQPQSYRPLRPPLYHLGKWPRFSDPPYPYIEHLCVGRAHLHRRNWRAPVVAHRPPLLASGSYEKRNFRIQTPVAAGVVGFGAPSVSCAMPICFYFLDGYLAAIGTPASRGAVFPLGRASSRRNQGALLALGV